MLWALCAAQLVTGRYDGSLRYSGLLREIGGRTGDPVALLGAAYGSGIVLHVRGRLPEALAKLEEGVATADRFAHQTLTLARTFQHDPGSRAAPTTPSPTGSSATVQPPPSAAANCCS